MKTQLNEIKRMQKLAGLIKENQDLMQEGFNPEETAAALNQARIKYKKDNHGGFIITRRDGQTAEIGDGGYGGYALYTSDNKIHQEKSDQTIEDIMDALIPWFNNY